MEKKLLKQRVIEFSNDLMRVTESLSVITQHVIANQMLRSGTAIGAMVHEAEFAETRDDFIHKLKVALKEANETNYWLNIAKNLVAFDDSLFQDLMVIIKILNKSILTAKRNRPKKT